MSDENNIKDSVILEKLEELIERKLVTTFTEEDYEALKKIIALYKGVEALGSFGNFIKSTLIYVGAIIGAIIAIRNGALDLLANWIGGANG